LYASGAPDIGTTIEEALALSAQAASAAASSDHGTSYGNYKIPSELLSTSTNHEWYSHDNSNSNTPSQAAAPETQTFSMGMPRGGWQADEAFYSHNPEDVFSSNPYDVVRENEYQQLHEQMHSEYGIMDQPQVEQDQRYVAHVCVFLAPPYFI
jgi:hypothetical protein